MRFQDLAAFFERLEATSKRLEMFDILADLFRQAAPDDIKPIIYMSQGRLQPAFQEGLEIGMSDKLLTRALAGAAQQSPEDVLARFKDTGDLGTTAEALLAGRAGEGLTVGKVYQEFKSISNTAGEGSVEKKLCNLTDLLAASSPREAKYIARFVMGRLRLGVGDATVLEALALAKLGGREFKPELERAYNLCSDLGLVGETAGKGGIDAIRTFAVQVGYPIRMSLCERVAEPEQIIDRMKLVERVKVKGSKQQKIETIRPCAVEPKLDGIRCQIHKHGEQVDIFSRNLERTTAMFPDIVEAVTRQVQARDIIFEGEALAFDEGTGELLPFQATIQRKRKHEVADYAKDFPLKLFVFDLLYVDGEDYTPRTYRDRRAELLRRIAPGSIIEPNESEETRDPARVRQIFEAAVARGLEGIVAKRMDSLYTAGARNFDWIKLKRNYKGELSDTVDLCVVGYFRGGGKRARFGIGTVLAAVFDPATDTFKTVSKVGTGFSDEEWVQLRERLDRVAVAHKPARVDSRMEPDVWVQPTYVITVAADEITRSPMHTCGADEQGVGYALRFPRVQGFLREDKNPEDANTVRDIIELYELQKRVKLE
ncbi:MAG: ATP-dependent DNA ligase [Nitrospirae bacterium]|nr:MAG: ATP-dependent DNA ligase [Nitrospirota bacterium]